MIRTIKVKGRFIDHASPKLLNIIWASLTTPQKLEVFEKIGIHDISASLVDWENIKDIIIPLRDKFIDASEEAFNSEKEY